MRWEPLAGFRLSSAQTNDAPIHPFQHLPMSVTCLLEPFIQLLNLSLSEIRENLRRPEFLPIRLHVGAQHEEEPEKEYSIN